MSDKTTKFKVIHKQLVPEKKQGCNPMFVAILSITSLIILDGFLRATGLTKALFDSFVSSIVYGNPYDVFFFTLPIPLMYVIRTHLQDRAKSNSCMTYTNSLPLSLLGSLAGSYLVAIHVRGFSGRERYENILTMLSIVLLIWWLVLAIYKSKVKGIWYI